MTRDSSSMVPLRLKISWRANGLEMSRPASQSQYRAKHNNRLAGSAPSSCWAHTKVPHALYLL